MDGITWHTLLLNTGLLSLLKCSDLRHFCPCELCQAMGTLGPMKILQNMEGGTFLWINCTSEGLGGEFLLIIIVAVLLTAFWGNFQKPQARWFLYVHFPARCFKKYFRSLLGCIQMEYHNFYGPGDKHAHIFNEPFLAVDLHLVHTFRAHSIYKGFKSKFTGMCICSSRVMEHMRKNLIAQTVLLLGFVGIWLYICIVPHIMPFNLH